MSPKGHDTSPTTGRIATVDGVMLHLSQPTATDRAWIGQDEILRQLEACWLTVDDKDFPLTPRIVGPPGIGKTTLGMAASQAQALPLYIYQCTSDTRPEDLIITPVLGDERQIIYHASPLVTAMLEGGVCILDEGNRMNEKSWASVAPLFDHRRTVESIIAGIQISAHASFRACVTMNEDESTFEIPDYILSRLQPTLEIEFPDRDDEMAILEYHLPFAEAELVALTVDFLQRAHELALDFSPRDGIHILRFAMKRLHQLTDHPVARDELWREALARVLGEEATNLEELARRRQGAAGDQLAPLGLGDFFFDPEDPLNPDQDPGEPN